MARPSMCSRSNIGKAGDPLLREVQLDYGEDSSLLEDFRPEDCLLVQHSATWI